MDSGFCVTKVLVELRKKGVFGAALMMKRRYWLTNIKVDAIDAQFASKELGNAAAVKQVEYGVGYHVFCIKEPHYVMKLMTTYGTLEPTDKSTRSKFKRGGVMETKEFMYQEVVAINFFIDIKLMTTKKVGMHPSLLRELGITNIGLIVALLSTLPYQK